MIDAFLLGVIVMGSLTAGLFFLRFWIQTRDRLFLAFSAAFIIEGLNRVSYLYIEQPNEGSPSIYFVRLSAFTLILLAIVEKNRSPR